MLNPGIKQNREISCLLRPSSCNILQALSPKIVIRAECLAAIRVKARYNSGTLNKVHHRRPSSLMFKGIALNFTNLEEVSLNYLRINVKPDLCYTGDFWLITVFFTPFQTCQRS